MDVDPFNPNQIDLRQMRPSITTNERFSNIINHLVCRERDGTRQVFTNEGDVLFQASERAGQLQTYIGYSRSFNEYLSDLMKGSKKTGGYTHQEGEVNGIRKKITSGIEGMTYSSPPFVIKESRSDKRITSDKYIPDTQLESLVVMNGLREFCEQNLQGIVGVPHHYGVVSYDLPTSNQFSLSKDKVELLIMEKVGDEKGTTVQDIEKNKAYTDNKELILLKYQLALSQLRAKIESSGFPSGILRDLEAHNFIFNPVALTDSEQAMFYLIDQ